MFPQRMDVLKSLLACDLIGFHLYEYARNFITSCRRLSGHMMHIKPGGRIAIECLGRNVVLRVAHVGIEITDILECIKEEEFVSFRL